MDAAVYTQAGRIFILENQGLGVFSSYELPKLGGELSHAQLGDMNNDGRMDLVVLNKSHGKGI